MQKNNKAWGQFLNSRSDSIKPMLKNRQYFVAILCLLGSVSGCSFTGGYAPVFTAGESEAQVRRYHVVQHGETLYSIAFKYGLDYVDIASANGITEPYTIFVDQRLNLTGTKKAPPRKVSKPAARKPATAVEGQSPKKSQQQNIDWRWPVPGEVVSGFSLTGKVNKGVDIQGRLGESVRAAADGVVVYAGGGLRGYGKLVIVKHDNKFLSAYGNNQDILVKEGQKVKAGEVLAEIGSSVSNQEVLHFEIRKNGKPEDPLIYLPDR